MSLTYLPIGLSPRGIFAVLIVQLPTPFGKSPSNQPASMQKYSMPASTAASAWIFSIASEILFSNMNHEFQETGGNGLAPASGGMYFS